MPFGDQTVLFVLFTSSSKIRATFRIYGEVSYPSF